MVRTVPTLAPRASAVRFGLQTGLIYENLRDVPRKVSYLFNIFLTVHFS